MIKIKRIKNKEDLRDALIMIHEDMVTFNIADQDQRNMLSRFIDSIKEE